MKVVIYSRVSTNSQDYKRQTEELLDFSKNMNYEVISIFEEKISGGKKKRGTSGTYENDKLCQN